VPILSLETVQESSYLESPHQHIQNGPPSIFVEEEENPLPRSQH
jgi:hypothetical protein